MISKLLALTLLSSTATAVLFYPTEEVGEITTPLVQATPPTPSQPIQTSHTVNNEKAKVELVFVLDTTGSMSDLIETAKEKIWSIATTMASAQPAPEIKIGLVAYRDRGDAYVTRVTDLSTDLDSMYATLMEYRAEGGGDHPESVNQAVYDAVHKISWSQGESAYKVIFLVGDAPPHMDYQDEVRYPDTIKAAVSKGIVINAIQAGNNSLTSGEWQQIAQLGNGDFFQVAQSGNAVAIASPYDHQLAQLSAQLDDTRLYYGNAEQKAKKALKMAATKKLNQESSLMSRARRATFNTTASGKANLLGDNELVNDVAEGRVELDEIAVTMLPEPMQTMSPTEQRQVIEELAIERKILKKEIQDLSTKRSDYLKKKVAALGSAKDDTLDSKLFSTLKSQAAAKGMVYESDAPDY